MQRRELSISDLAVLVLGGQPPDADPAPSLVLSLFLQPGSSWSVRLRQLLSWCRHRLHSLGCPSALASIGRRVLSLPLLGMSSEPPNKHSLQVDAVAGWPTSLFLFQWSPLIIDKIGSPPHNPYVEALILNVTVFGDRVFEEVTEVK